LFCAQQEYAAAAMVLIESIPDDDERVVSQAQEVKEEGNRRFAEGDFSTAAELYTRAIDLLTNYSASLLPPSTAESPSNLDNNANHQRNASNDEPQSTPSEAHNDNNLESDSHDKASFSEEQHSPTKEEIHTGNKPKILEKFSSYTSVYYCNRGACFLNQRQFDKCVSDCTVAIALQPHYMKALLRRAKAQEELGKFREALRDYEDVLNKDATVKEALQAVRTLPPRVKEQEEREKAEVLGKLKDLGNSFLGLFGMSLDNFKMQQDPNSGGYSVNYQPGAKQ